MKKYLSYFCTAWTGLVLFRHCLADKLNHFFLFKEESFKHKKHSFTNIFCICVLTCCYAINPMAVSPVVFSFCNLTCILRDLRIGVVWLQMVLGLLVVQGVPFPVLFVGTGKIWK